MGPRMAQTQTGKRAVWKFVFAILRGFLGQALGACWGESSRARSDSSRSRCNGTDLLLKPQRGEGQIGTSRVDPSLVSLVPPSLPSSSTGVVRPGPNGHGGSRPALSIRRNTGPLVELWEEQPISAQSRHKSAQTRQVFEPIADRSRDLLTVSRMLLAFAVGTLSGRLDRQPPHLHLAAAGGRPSIPPHTHTSSPHPPRPPPAAPNQPSIFGPLPLARRRLSAGTHRGQQSFTGAHPLSPLSLQAQQPPMARCGSRYPPSSSGHRPRLHPRPSLALLGRAGQSALMLPTLRHTPPGPPMDPPTGPPRGGRGDWRCALRTWTHRARNITYCP